jgi:hypothetical protein
MSIFFGKTIYAYARNPSHRLPPLEIDHFCTLISFVQEYICLQICKWKEMIFLREIVRKRSFGTHVLQRAFFSFKA